jgi:dihydroorotase
VIDSMAVVRQVREIARRRGVVKVDPIGALTVDRAGVSLTEMAELVDAGCVGFSDNPSTIADAGLMRNALSYAAMLGVPVMVHCEDPKLSKGSAMHEGAVSTRLGLPGAPAAAEEAIIARDIALAELTGAHIHICTVSTARGVALIRAARERGVNVTAEVTPHHLTLTDRWVLGSMTPVPPPPPTPRQSKRAARRAETGLGLPSWLDPSRLPPYDTSTRISPPLRSEEDCEALIEGLRDGTIDAIASDHTPHTAVEKEREYQLAEPGIVGLETALALTLTLVHRGKMDLVDLVAKLTEGPATVLGRSPATLRPGQYADIVIFDPDKQWTVDPRAFLSRGRSTPLVGQQLRGQVMLTLVRGQVAFRRDTFGLTQSPQQASKLEGILEEGG